MVTYGPGVRARRINKGFTCMSDVKGGAVCLGKYFQDEEIVLIRAILITVPVKDVF